MRATSSPATPTGSPTSSSPGCAHSAPICLTDAPEGRALELRPARTLFDLPAAGTLIHSYEKRHLAHRACRGRRCSRTGPGGGAMVDAVAHGADGDCRWRVTGGGTDRRGWGHEPRREHR